MNLRKWEVALLGLAIVSLAILLVSRTIGRRAVASEGAVSRVASPGVAFWGEEVDTELRIDSNQLPSCGTTADVEPIYTALVIDRSGSMSGTPITEARNAASDFVDLMNLGEEGDAVTVVVFDDTAQVVQPITQERRLAVQAIQLIRDLGGTNIAEGLRLATQELVAAETPPNARQVMILLSDGEDGQPQNAIAIADQAKSQGIRVVTIALGDADRTTLQQIASSDTDYYETVDASDLLDIYGEIAAGLVGSLATNVTVQEQYNNEDFTLLGGLYRVQQNGNQFTWQLPFVGRGGRSVGYLLEPNGLGWHEVSPTAGELSLTDCNGQLLNQATSPGPRVLVLFPVWLLYIGPTLALLWLLYRLRLALRPAAPTPVAAPGQRIGSGGNVKADKEKPKRGSEMTHNRPTRSRPKKRK